MPRPLQDQAFIASHPALLRTAKCPQLCTRTRERRAASRVWRCVVQDGSGKTDEVGQLEGAVPFDAFDAGLQEALSKGWDKLENFGNATVGPDKELPADEKKDTRDADEEVGVMSDERVAATEDAEPVVLDSLADTEASDSVVAEKPKAKRKRASKKKTTSKKSAKQTDLTLEEIQTSSEWITDPRWYFVQVKPGYEQSTAISIRNLANSLDNNEILEVLVPTTTIMRLTKGGRSVKKEERFFPSYILVLMVMNRRNYSEILAVPNVQFFMGDPNREKKKDAPLRPPLPVKDAEMKKVFEKIREADSAKPEIKTAMRPGDSIEVISGSFVGNIGRVLEVKPDLNLVKANLHIFNRETAVELEFHQVKVIDDIMNPREPPSDKEEQEAPQRLKKRGRRKTNRFTEDSSQAGVSTASDDLAAILGTDEDDAWNPFSEHESAKERQSELQVGRDDGFDEAEVVKDDGDDGFGEAVVLDDESGDDFGEPAVPHDKTDVLATAKDATGDENVDEKRGLVSSEDDLDALLGGAGGSGWDPSAEGSREEDLQELEEFFSSLENGDTDKDSIRGDKRSEDESEDSEGGALLDEEEQKLLAEEAMAKRLEGPEREDDDEHGIGGPAILEELNEMMADIASGKRKPPTYGEGHDLNEPIVVTKEDIPEIDLFNMPDIDAHKDPDTSADPLPKKR